MLPVRGMTLFEIVVSLGLVVISFVVVISAIPVGLRLQEKARFQLYASAKAIDLITSFNTLAPGDRGTEGQSSDGPWDVQTAYRPTVFDLEQRLSNQINGLAPVPLDIARRLDSDNDEIQALLAAGGKLYYPMPMATDSLNGVQTVRLPPDEARRMVIGIIGDAQDNQIPSFPGRAWPMYSAFPAPTRTGMGLDSTWEAVDRKPDPSNPAAAWDSLPLDNDYRVVHGNMSSNDDPAWAVTMAEITGTPSQGGAIGYSPLNGDHDRAPATQEGALRYMALALWYAQRKALPDPWLAGTRGAAADIDALLAEVDRRARWSSAIRLLASAGMTLTRHYSTTELEAGVIVPTYTVHIPWAADQNAPAAPVSITLAMIRTWHENCLDVAMAYAARLPYDWGQLRPFNRAIFSDAPLLQWDLFGPRFSGTLVASKRDATSYPAVLTTLGNRVAVSDVGTAARQAEQYKVLTPDVVRNATNPAMAEALKSLALPILATDALRPDGETEARNATLRCNLTAPFHPSQRCRQMVFWSVDWQSYEDFESAPSHPVDASRYVLLSGRDATFAAGGWNSRMTIPIGVSEIGENVERPSFRNPERHLLFLAPPPSLQPGTSTFYDDFIFGEESSGRYAENYSGSGYDMVPDTRAPLSRPWKDTSRSQTFGEPGYIFSGLYGADRNGNKHYDRGLRPATQRLRAITISRFIIYDPRLPMLLR